MFDYLGTGFLQVTKDKELSTNGYDPDNPIVVEMGELVDAYMDKIGKNTEYFFHPEEIMAVTFAFIAAKETDGLPTPELLTKVKKVLEEENRFFSR